MTASAAPEHARPAKRNPLAVITESKVFQWFILLCIIINALMLGYEAQVGANNPYSAQIAQWNAIFLWIFTAELVLEFLAQGPRAYVRNGWNLFDVVIVGVSWIAAAPGATALRALRVIRVFRLVSNVPQMQRVVEALMRAMPGIFATLSILAIVYYIGAVTATTLFGAQFPDRFGNLLTSGMTLFQLTLFDDWGNIVFAVAEEYSWAWSFFLIFTVLSAFAVLNLFIGVIVDAVQEARDAERKAADAKIQKEVVKIEREVDKIEDEIEDGVAVQRRILDELKELRASVEALRNAPPR